MKKRLVLTIFITLALLIPIGSSIFLSSKQEALNYFQSYKAQREAEISNSLGTVEMITDKVCTIDYNTERIKCEACFNITSQERETTHCVALMPDASDKEDNEMITAKAREVLNWEHPLEDIAYTEKEISGTELEVRS